MNKEVFMTNTFYKNEMEYCFVINKATGVTLCYMKEASFRKQEYPRTNEAPDDERTIRVENILEKLNYVHGSKNDIRIPIDHIDAKVLAFKTFSICHLDDEFDVETGCANAFMKAFREYQSDRCQDINNLIRCKEREINALKELKKSYQKEFKDIQKSVESKKYKPYRLTTSVKNFFSGITEKFKRKSN